MSAKPRKGTSPRRISGHLTLDQAAARLGVARSTVRMWAYSGRIASYKPHIRSVLIPVRAVEQYLVQRTRPSVPSS